MLSCLCDWHTLKTTCGLLDSCPTTGLLTLPRQGEAGDDGEWLTKVSVPYEAAPLYAPQGVEMGGGGSASKLVRYSRLVRTNN